MRDRARDVNDKVGLGRPHRRRRLFDDGDLRRCVRVRAGDDKTGPRKHERRDTDEKWPGHAPKREPHAPSWLADKCVSAVVIFDDSLSSIRASALLLLLHLHDRDRQTADGAAIDLEVELVDAVAREAHVVELHDHVDVLPGDSVHRDLGGIRHRLLPVGSEQPHAHGMSADLEAKDGDDEHAWMLRRQPAHRDVAEDPHEADLSVLSDECVVAERGEPDLGCHDRCFVTMFTRRSCTTTTRSTIRPSSAAFARGLARAIACACACGSPAAAGMRSRTLPSTWTTRVISFTAASAGSNAGQACWCTEPLPPRRSQSSSAKCGANGASRRTSVSIPYSRLVPRARESVVESSIIAAIAVLKW